MIARDLQGGILHHFPVWYPPHVRSLGTMGIDLLWGDPYQGRDTRTISFENSFGQQREQEGDGPTTYHVTHGAIDIIAGFGCEVRSTVDGEVVETWYAFPDEGRDPRPGVGFQAYSRSNPKSGGNYAMILDAQGYHHYYAHMMYEPQVGVGQSVSAGQKIGFVGATGLRPGSVQHLHYQTTRRTEWRAQSFNPYRELRRLAEDTVPGVRLYVSPGGRVYLRL
ncbi:MAG TPA: M23 family metallopeptidase [Sandaracinaceae bacterium LLY-WYZ-13_1]|nr:M23 family metallopeptidase [Sandaracinaceae bacterium LLY-WYZ-13_1]